MKKELLFQISFHIVFAVIWSALFAKFYPNMYNFVNKFTKAGDDIQADLEFTNTIILRVPFLLLFVIIAPIVLEYVN
tara:strand:- start:862 stop:1092 length:231 start_codon:yes stop_codon:yes gene_type:complete